VVDSLLDLSSLLHELRAAGRSLLESVEQMLVPPHPSQADGSTHPPESVSFWTRVDC
jgi:hypothetical protein